MPFALRWANEEDAPAIKRLVRESNLNPLGIQWQRFIVADDGGRIVGMGQVKVHGDGSRELASIAAVPDRRGEGIATAIIETLLNNTLRKAEGGDIYLTCRAHNEAFYERFGFRRVSEPQGVPPHFARLVRLINAAHKVGRALGLREYGLVMVRKGA